MSDLRLVNTPSTPDPGGNDGDGEVPASAFDERFGISLFGRTYYINVRIGSELRAPERLAAEGQVRVSGVAFLYCLVCSAAIMLFGTLALVYLMKSGMGINFTDGHSFLHPLFEAFN